MLVLEIAAGIFLGLILFSIRGIVASFFLLIFYLVLAALVIGGACWYFSVLSIDQLKGIGIALGSISLITFLVGFLEGFLEDTFLKIETFLGLVLSIPLSFLVLYVFILDLGIYPWYSYIAVIFTLLLSARLIWNAYTEYKLHRATKESP